ncbi:hypothetical protein E2R51_16400 [Jeotgalibacillus sp. S-D1]|uniref:hypothetical protein n=1 Tax=Jeotgalibacillus sp. S-D1 TaxID=2552189 RepID=UPI00105925F1|nr:hypothetical protein [Jeotgalibacillus sp. S-D1]TDL30906.1 hypothetical protein E2R51_16400 [Jeotgalibacillus sp. S-D1]
MVIENFFLALAIYGKPMSYNTPEPDKDAKIFTSDDIMEILNVHSSFHFNKGDSSFFTQHGPTSYSYWARTFSLSEEETEELDDDNDEAVSTLFKKLKDFFEDNNITKAQFEKINHEFDLERKCNITLFVPRYINGTIFEIKTEDLQFMANHNLNFNYLELTEDQIEKLKNVYTKTT